MSWDDDPEAVAPSKSFMDPTAQQPSFVVAHDFATDELRDEFAMQFMNGIVSIWSDEEALLGYVDPDDEANYEREDRRGHYDRIATAAYEMADAMLKARKRV